MKGCGCMAHRACNSGEYESSTLGIRARGSLGGSSVGVKGCGCMAQRLCSSGGCGSAAPWV